MNMPATSGPAMNGLESPSTQRPRVIIAAPGLRNEPGLVAAAVSAGIQVVRRPVDAADLLAAAVLEPTTAVVVGVDLPRISLDVIARLEPAQRRVIGIWDAQGQDAEFKALGVQTVLDCTVDPANVIAQLMSLLAPRAEVAPDPSAPRDTDLWEEITPAGPGRLIAVWGPAGAPGRSTIAIELSAELARKRLRICTVDADTHAPALAMRLGVLDDVSGLIVACRHADNGSLATRSLLSTTRLIDDRWYLLTGLGRSERWPDLRPAALERLWTICCKTFDATVVDIGSCLETSPAQALPGLAVERNAAALSALTRADGVLVVARPDALSVARLISGLPHVCELAGDSPIRVVMTHVERRDRRPARFRELLRRAGFDLPLHEVALDARSFSRALDRGTTMRQVAPTSRSRRGIRELGDALAQEWAAEPRREAPVRAPVAA